MSENEVPWVSVESVCNAYGVTFASAKIKIKKGTFDVPTYKVGKKHVIDKRVHEQYFKGKREGYSSRSQNNKQVSIQMNVSIADLKQKVNATALSVFSASGYVRQGDHMLCDGNAIDKAFWNAAAVAYVNDNWGAFDNPEDVIDLLVVNVD